MPELYSSLASGGLGLIGSAMQYKYASKLAEQQNQYNIDMWKMQADYNSPQAQMQRYQEAGLNPNLIYGQGTSGNMSSAPEQVTPNAPELDKHMAELGKAFNIENLRTTIANRKRAEAEAQEAAISAANEKDKRSALHDYGALYSFNPVTGKYEFTHGFTSYADATRKQKALKDYTGSWSNREYYFNQLQENQYKNLELIPYRAALYEMQKRFLVPQIAMANYESKYKPYSFWIGQGSKALNSLTSIPATFSPLKWTFKPSSIRNFYNYY